MLFMLIGILEAYPSKNSEPAVVFAYYIHTEQSAYCRSGRACCLRLFWQLEASPASHVLFNTERSRTIRITVIATAISNSIKENFIFPLLHECRFKKMPDMINLFCFFRFFRQTRNLANAVNRESVEKPHYYYSTPKEEGYTINRSPFPISLNTIGNPFFKEALTGASNVMKGVQ